MRPEFLELLKKHPDARLSETNEEFDRVVKCSEIQGNKIVPTIADSHYYSNYDIPEEVKVMGFYTGDLDAWIPLLIHDGWLDTSQDICKVTFAPPQGSIVLHDTKMSFGGIHADDYIVEEFVVHNAPIEAKVIKKMTKKEISYYENIAIESDPYTYEYP